MLYRPWKPWLKNEEYTSHFTIYLRTTASAGAMLKTTPTADHKLFQIKVSTTWEASLEPASCKSKFRLIVGVHEWMKFVCIPLWPTVLLKNVLFKWFLLYLQVNCKRRKVFAIEKLPEIKNQLQRIYPGIRPIKVIKHRKSLTWLTQCSSNVKMPSRRPSRTPTNATGLWKRSTLKLFVALSSLRTGHLLSWRWRIQVANEYEQEKFLIFRKCRVHSSLASRLPALA